MATYGAGMRRGTASADPAATPGAPGGAPVARAARRAGRRATGPGRGAATPVPRPSLAATCRGAAGNASPPPPIAAVAAAVGAPSGLLRRGRRRTGAAPWPARTPGGSAPQRIPAASPSEADAGRPRRAARSHRATAAAGAAPAADIRSADRLPLPPRAATGRQHCAAASKIAGSRDRGRGPRRSRCVRRGIRARRSRARHRGRVPAVGRRSPPRGPEAGRDAAVRRAVARRGSVDKPAGPRSPPTPSRPRSPLPPSPARSGGKPRSPTRPRAEAARYGPFTRLQWAGAVGRRRFGLLVAAAMAVLFVRWLLGLDFMQDFLATYPGEYPLPEGARWACRRGSAGSTSSTCS